MKDILKDYRDLARLSEDDANLYASRIVSDRLTRDAGSPDFMEGLICMQLAQREYEDLFSDLFGGISDAESNGENACLQDRLHNAFQKMVSDRINGFPEADRRGILLRTIYQANAWCGRDMKSYDLLQLSSLPTEALIDECACIVERMTVDIMSGMSFDEAEPQVRHIADGDGSVRISAASAAIANYMNDPQKRDEPEALAEAAVAGEHISQACAAGSSDVIYAMIAIAAVVFCGGFLFDALIAMSAYTATAASIDTSGIRRRLAEMMESLKENIGLMAGVAVTGITCRLPGMLRQMYDGLVHRKRDSQPGELEQAGYDGDYEIVIRDVELESEEESDDIVRE